MLLRAGLVVVCLISAGSARADQLAVEPDVESPHLPGWSAATVQWSTWIRLGYGMGRDTPGAESRMTSPPPPEWGGRWEAGVGADLTFPLAARGDLRFGPWAELRTGSIWPVVGAELQLGAAPRELDMFFYNGEGLLTVRGGGNHDVITGAISWGYRCPWALFDYQGDRSLYMIGARVVVAATRAIDDPHDWTATIGLEVEPVGALRYLLGIRSWY